MALQSLRSLNHLRHCTDLNSPSSMFSDMSVYGAEEIAKTLPRHPGSLLEFVQPPRVDGSTRGPADSNWHLYSQHAQ